MKKTTLTLLALFAAATTYAQGSFLFGNRPSAIGGTGAPVGYAGDLAGANPAAGGPVDRVAGSQWLSQLVVAGVPVPGTINPFGSGGAAGFIPNSAVVLNGVSPGSTVAVQLAAWFAPLGADYSAAVAAGVGGVGLSNPVNVTLKEATDPTLNAPVGLQGFNIPSIVPEPSLAALGLLGASVLLLRRRK